MEFMSQQQIMLGAPVQFEWLAGAKELIKVVWHDPTGLLQTRGIQFGLLKLNESS